jgi:hypothetical protein
MSIEHFGNYSPDESIEEKAIEAKAPQFPEVSIPESSLWDIRVAEGLDGIIREIGVAAPDGTYYELQEGEKFIINKGEGREYEAIIISSDGERKVLNKPIDTVSTTAENSIEYKEAKELHENIKIAAQYLNRLDEYAEFVQIHPETGAIIYDKPILDDITDERVKGYQQNFTELLRTFLERNQLYIQQLQSDPHILDIKEIAGAIMVTYDSSKGIPNIGMGISDNARGIIYPASSEYLGLAIIDINASKRQDGVSPTISAIHELQHHTLAISDYLISQDESLGMQSTYRDGRTAELYGLDSDTMTTEQALLHDSEKYSELLGREFDAQVELPRIQDQLSYLEELHSSYLQRKVNWFHAQENVYSTKGKGKHWELVGDHPDDIASSKRLLGYLQGFYTLDIVKQMYMRALESGQPIGEGQKKFINECDDAFREAGSLIGAARTIQQAEFLVSEAWQSFIDNNPKLTSSPEFNSILAQWENGSGIENLRDIILDIE